MNNNHRCGAPARYTKIFTAFVAAVLSGALLCASPIAAYADTESDLASARSQLEEIGTKADELTSQLETLNTELMDIQNQILVKSDRLDEAQETLSSYVALEYKSDDLNIISAVVGAESLGDAISRIAYLGKIQSKMVSAIEDVTNAKAELASKEEEQQKSVDETQAALDELNSQRETASNLVNSLSAELMSQLAAEAESNSALSSGLAQSEAGTATSASDVVSNNQTSNTSNSSNNSSNSSSNTATAGKGNVGGDPNSGITYTTGDINFSNRQVDSSLYTVTWSGDTEYINKLAAMASKYGSDTNYFITFDNTLLRVIVFQRSGGGWTPLYTWNCTGGRTTYSGVFTVTDHQACSWADRYASMYGGPGFNDWATCYIECYSSTDNGHCRYIEDKGYETCAQIHRTCETRPWKSNTGCCGLLNDQAYWVWTNCGNGTTVFEFDQYSFSKWCRC